MNKVRQTILYAPNINIGGGLILLKTLLSNWSGPNNLIAILDHRAKESLENSCSKLVKVVYWVRPSLPSYVWAEVTLYLYSKKEDLLLCFHNLPPLIPNSSRVFIFLQNRLILQEFPWRLTLNHRSLIILLEKFIFKYFSLRRYSFIVQTQSMHTALRALLTSWWSDQFQENIILTLSIFPSIPPKNSCQKIQTKYDFIYPSSSDRHKNHINLIKAWKILADDGLQPSLALTLGPPNSAYHCKLNSLIKEYKLNVIDLGPLPYNDLIESYAESGALIFPSQIESLGLPLHEANVIGLPILAGELDYVRDVCCPIESFNPDSPMSIARSVKRYLKIKNPPSHNPINAIKFWDTLCTLDN